ncbi:bifunctional tetrahydrofolate synthase/dihydrofolate synthase [Thalassotalea crassostreae]|uniref:bifunctional tetrahydrofolate synthase/dihydrofolate synthase n=1 Tax=Thalassotalea crassostreae TaxID=1763536 RepID=UPI00083822D8|nr:bifunctional tetrahydrofolate synthase/dihydrofolate synthase [Thalassotalea crassostreae]
MNTNKCHSFSSLDEWLFYLESIHPSEIDMGLTRIREVGQRLNIDLTNSKIITVAGTNGKGTTCAFIENALLSLGHSVAVYSSPHIETFNERLRFNKALVDDKSLIDAFAQIETARAEITLTYYEYTTLAALMIASDKKTSFLILEVGLGGRLDATNMIDCDVAVITSIDLDHQSYLGDTRELIGYEKAGIARADKPIIIGDTDIPISVIEHCQLLNCQMYKRGAEFNITGDRLLQPWDLTIESESFKSLAATNIPRDNVATALMTLSVLGMSLKTDDINQWISDTCVEGRTEVVQNEPMIVLDVGHNPHAARYLNKFVKSNNKPQVHAVCAMLADKDIESTLTEMLDCIDHWYVGNLDVSRGAKAEKLEKILQQSANSVNSFDNVNDAYRIAVKNANNNDMILVFGSFYTVASIKKAIF